MFKNFFGISLALVAAICLTLVSCEDNSLVDTSADNTVSQAFVNGGDYGDRGHRRGRGHRGRHDCFDLVFPVSISFPDGTVETYDSKDSLRAGFRAFKRTDTTDQRPTFVFPITVMLEDSTTQEIVDEAAFEALKESCRPAPCFEFVYPVSLSFDDGTTASYDNRDSLKAAIRDYYQANPNSDRPELVYPVTVTLADSTTQEIVDEDAFEDLREACHDQYDDDDDDDDDHDGRGGRRGGRGRG